MSERCPLHPRKRTFGVEPVMFAKCQKRKWQAFFDSLSARASSVLVHTAAAVGIFAHWPYLLTSHRSLSMAKGIVKWFNPTKGYGFIQPTGGGGKDVFVHISAVEKAGLSTLNEGQTVEYEEVPNKGKTSAENLKVV